MEGYGRSGRKLRAAEAGRKGGTKERDEGEGQVEGRAIKV